MRKLLCLLLLLLALGPGLQAADDDLPPKGTKILTLTPKLVPSTLRPGEKFRLEIQAKIIPGWHIYSVIPQGEDAPPPTSLSGEQPHFLPDGPFYETRPIEEFDKVIGLKLAYHEIRAVLYQNYGLALDAPLGQGKFTFKVHFQTCSDRICLPPQWEEFTLDYLVEAGDLREPYLFSNRTVEPIERPLSGANLPDQLAGGIGGFLLLAALMGLVSLITPCVFPMIPITVSFFAKQAEGSRSRLLKLASLFGLGIIGTYTGTGMIFSLLFGAGAAVQLATNPWVNLVIALVFVVFAFSLMGLFELNLPGGLQNYLDTKSRNLGGVAGVLLMGTTFTLTAFTCTVQFVGTMLIVAAQGHWFWPLVGMLVFSSVFAFPFFLLALAPGLIQSLRGKSGAWMGRAKVVLGLLELMASLKFISNADLVWQTNLLSRDLVLALWALLLGLSLAYLVWTGIKAKSRWQWFWSGVLTLALVFTLQGMGGNSLGSLMDSILPPAEVLRFDQADMISQEEAKSLVWHDQLAEAQKVARAKGQLIFVDFTGYTCVNCRWMEQNVFVRQDVFQRFQKMQLVRLYTDGGPDAQANLDYQIKAFGTVALPLYVILDTDLNPLRKFHGIALTPKEFLEFLDGQPLQKGAK